jgi:two-component system, LytTR family, sensor kinase
MTNEARFRRAASPNWRRVWAGLLILWTIFAGLGTWFNYGFLAARGTPVTWIQSVRMNVVWYGIWGVLLTPAVLFLCAKMPLAKKRWPVLVAAHVILISAIVCFDVLIKALWGTRVFTTMHELPFIPQFKRVFFSQAEPDIQIYLVVAVLSYVVAYYTELRSQEWHRAELENNLVRAELQVLRTQLQPHFLFNTLHSVAALVNTDPRAAQRMICSLGDLLRMSLAGQDHPESTLKQELEFLELYLDVQRVRFQDQLVMEIKFDTDVLNAEVPSLLLQPLAENAIKHGVAKRPGCKVEICSRKEADMVCVNVVNDNGVSHDDRERERLGIGLDNIRSRLRILYGTKGRLLTQTLPNGRFQVEVWIPFRTGPRSDLEIQALTSAA